MKKLFTLIAILQILAIARAQQLPNGGFEQWTTTAAPDQWSTNSSAFRAAALPFPNIDYFAVRDTVQYREGHASLRLTTDTFTFQGLYTYASQAGLGTGTFNGHSIDFSGVPFAHRLITFSLRYRYDAARPIDSGLMQLDLTAAGSSILHHGLGWHIGSTGGLWDTAFFLLDSTDYTSHSVPDTLKLTFYSSVAGGGADPQSLGCKLWLDDIQVSVEPNASTNDVPTGSQGISIYPSPSADVINISIPANELGSEIKLFDIEGKLVYQGKAEKTNMQLDSHSLPVGTYSLFVKSTDKITTYQNKVIIAHNDN